MKKRGAYLAVTGLVIGLLLGWAISFGRNILRRELVSLLEDMVARSCDCQFKTDEVDVHFIPPYAVAYNSRIESDGKVKLQFNTISVRVDLSKIREHKILLKDLNLEEGTADGVGPDSATFKFIDLLTAPLPPEKDYPGRWKAILVSLNVIDSKFIERYSSSELIGDGVQLALTRTQSDQFLLLPRVADLKFRVFRDKNKEKSFDVSLGHVATKLLIPDGKLIFHELKDVIGASTVNMEAESIFSKNNELSGSTSFLFDASSFPIPFKIESRLVGEAEVSGTLGNPLFNGQFGVDPNFTTRYFFFDLGTVDITSGTGKLFFALNRGNPKVTVSSLEARGPLASLKSGTPIKLENDKLSGRLDISVENFTSGSLSVSGVTLGLTLGGTPLEATFNIAGHASSAALGDLQLPDINFTVDRTLNQVVTKATHVSEQFGKLSTDIIFSRESEDQSLDIKSLIFNIDNFAGFGLFERDSFSSLAQRTRFSGSGEISGPIDISKIKGSANITISSPFFSGESALNGAVSLDKGVITSNLTNQTGSIGSKISYDLLRSTDGELDLSLNNLKLEEYDPSLECINLTGSLAYRFRPTEFKKGAGKIKLGNSEFGCEPYNLKTGQLYSIEIRDGGLELPSIALEGTASSIVLSGNMSLEEGYNLSASGGLNLNSLLGFMPYFDDLTGSVFSSLTIKGPLNKPIISGSADIKNAELSVESANISADEVTGILKIKDNEIEIGTLEGELNDGEFAVTGKIYPFDIYQSSAALSLKNVVIAPADNTVVELSGEIALGREDSGRPLITGAITIDNANFEKNLDLRTILEFISKSLLPISKAEAATESLPDIDVDLQLKADRDLFFRTNFAAVELRGNIRIYGSLNNQIREGKLDVVSGWFGLRNRRFNITSGNIVFRADSKEPYLELLAETVIRSASANNILVFLEAGGPLLNPKIKLSSDQGIPEGEILSLLTAESSVSGTKTSPLDLREQEITRKIGESEFAFAIRRLFRTITTIDSLSFEPKLNAQTGSVEPVIIAVKKISDSTSLSAENTFSSIASESKVELLHELLPYLTISGIISSVSTQENTSFRVDASYTVLAKEKVLTKTHFHGNISVPDSKILQALQLNKSSLVPPSDTANIESELTKYYKSLGYFRSVVSVSCVAQSDYCNDLTLNIEEGPRSKIRSVVLEGDPVDSIISPANLQPIYETDFATGERIKGVAGYLLQSLRSEGYIGAKVRRKYILLKTSDDVDLKINISTGEPVTFVFDGNVSFTSNELLDTINLFARKQPFGNNTINILTENIERLYRESGYLFATIHYDHVLDPETRRVTYHIQIEEGPKVSVAEVLLEGNSSISGEVLRNLVAEKHGDLFTDIFNPQFAIDEDIKYFSKILRDIYVDEGYPGTEVRYEILPDDRSRSAEIKYIFHEGDKLNASNLEIDGFPKEIELPIEPDSPYSIPKANKYIDSILTALSDKGYLSPMVSSNFDQDSDKLRIAINPGVITKIDKIVVKGNLDIDESTILNKLTISPGSAWDTLRIAESRRKLLQLGVFSRVELKPQDGELNQELENLLVLVVERPLDTMDIGSGLDSESGVHLFGEATDRFLFRDGRSLSLRGDVFFNTTSAEVARGIASLGYTDPSLLESDYGLSENLVYQRNQSTAQEFDLERVSLNSILFRSWEDGIKFSFGHTLAQEDITNVSPGSIISDEDSGILDLSYVAGTFGYDKRDNSLNPSKGYNATFDYKVSSKSILSDVNFATVGAKAGFIVPFRFVPKLSLANSTQFALGWPFGDTDNIPISQRFYLGGANSVRGFRDSSLGPRADDGSVIGGDTLLANNFEVRYLIADGLQAITFLDAGQVYLRDDSLSFGDIRFSTGVGIRYISPIGPIGFDIGHPIDERQGEPSLRLHFRVGTNF